MQWPLSKEVLHIFAIPPLEGFFYEENMTELYKPIRQTVEMYTTRNPALNFDLATKFALISDYNRRLIQESHHELEIIINVCDALQRNIRAIGCNFVIFGVGSFARASYYNPDKKPNDIDIRIYFQATTQATQEHALRATQKIILEEESLQQFRPRLIQGYDEESGRYFSMRGDQRVTKNFSEHGRITIGNIDIIISRPLENYYSQNPPEPPGPLGWPDLESRDKGILILVYDSTLGFAIYKPNTWTQEQIKAFPPRRANII